MKKQRYSQKELKLIIKRALTSDEFFIFIDESKHFHTDKVLYAKYHDLLLHKIDHLELTKKQYDFIKSQATKIIDNEFSTIYTIGLKEA